MLEAIETFLAVANGRMLEEVGPEQGLTASGVTRRIQKLEEKLNTRLFVFRPERTLRGSRLELTPAGEAFLPHAQNAVQEIEAGRRAVAQLTQQLEKAAS